MGHKQRQVDVLGSPPLLNTENSNEFYYSKEGF